MITRALVCSLVFAACASVAFADDAPATAAAVQRPTIPDKAFSIKDFGAVADGKTPATAGIQKAIDECMKAGGGMVTVPAGTYVTGPLTLGSSMNLHLEKGAVLQFSANAVDFPLGANGQRADELTVRRCHDVAITGEGTIDGSGAAWWPPAKGVANAAAAPAIAGRVPELLLLSGTRLLVQDVTFVNAPGTAIYALPCDNLTVEHVTVKAPESSPKTTGLDVLGKNIAVSHCTFDVGDDDVCVHPFGGATGQGPACENIMISDCTILHGKGIVVGNQTTGGLRNMRVSDCTFDGTQYGIRMRTDRARGGTVQDVSYDNLTMNNVKFPIQFASYFPTIPKSAANDPAQAVSATTPLWKNIRITKLTANGALTAGSIVGLPEQPIDGVTLTDVTINATHSMEVTHAKNVSLVNTHVGVEKGKPVVVSDAQVTGAEAVGGAGEALP